MKRKLLTMLLGVMTLGTFAQRQTDVLDRGLVAVNTSKGIFCSWRIPANEYYDVTYNIYRDGTKLNDTPLAVSNYLDAGGSTSSQYSVEAVVRGKAQEKSAAVTPWSTNYLEVKMDHGSLTSTFIPNDACCADVDGDGEVEILLKFDNNSDASKGYLPAGNNGEYAIVEVYKLNGTKLWWLDFGPNMGDFQNNENNIVAFDWDQDGKAEAVMRAADGTTIHTATGETIVIGDNTKNYRSSNGQSGQWFIHEGAEYLLYLNGATGEVYDKMDYPLKRLESGETNLEAAWGDGYGHRSTKHFFGAPFLDGRKPSIFLARGIYTRHKMIALDVDPSTHKLTERWRWNCSTSGSAWYGQGYHNFGVADVDWDGRDEIVYGSMVIDDNGKGLSTTGLGHGDSQHCGDFDPYTHGQEIFACNEDRPNNNFRDATTSKIYYRSTGGNDDGRCLAGNFVDEIPGAQAISSRDANLIGGAAQGAVSGYSKSSFSITQNFRIYWDGDLCEESFDYFNGKNTEGRIVKAKTGNIAILTGSMTNNDTKGTPDFQGDILGDWREEVIMRTADNNIRIYTTNVETPWRNYSLWYDHQYRNAMVWQMCGYNQTPHVSYFLGEMEGITVAPPPLTMTGRTEIANGATIGTAQDDQHIMMCETGDMNVTVNDGAKPYIFTDNAPTWVQGHDNNDNITTTTYTHTLTGGAFTGEMRLVKQGDGVLVLPNVTETYTGPTDVWAGTLNFDGTLKNSRLWLNRHTSLQSNGGKFTTIEADYNATICPGGKENKGNIEVDSLIMNFGSRLNIDIYSDGTAADQVNVGVLKIGTVDWKNGPVYSTPIIQFVAHPAEGATKLEAGKYLIGQVGSVDGDIANFTIEGLNGKKSELTLEDGKLYITVTDYASGNVTWTGAADKYWNIDESLNFLPEGESEARGFVHGDAVTFDDNATNTTVVVDGNMAPSSIVFNNETKSYTISGDSIVGDPDIVKNGAGKVTINSVNHIGSTTINGGNLTVNSLANEIGQDYGALGSVSSPIIINNDATLGISANVTTSQDIKVASTGATVDVASGATLTMNAGFAAVDTKQTGTLTKAGSGTLTLSSSNKLSKLVIKAGTVNNVESNGVAQLPQTVEFVNGILYDSNSQGSTTTNNANFVVAEGNKGFFYADPRCNYNGTLTGAGTFTVYAAGVRNYFAGDWSQFEGTIIPGLKKRGTYDPSFDFTSTKGLGKATLQMNSGVTFKNNGHDVEVKKITGNGSLSGTGKYIITGDEDFTFSATSESPVVKRGASTMRVYSAGRFTSSVTVEEGTLSVTMLSLNGDKFNGNGSLSVRGNGTLQGNLKANSLQMSDNGVLQLYSTSPTKMVTTGILSCGGNSTVKFLLSSSSNSTLEIGSYLYLVNVDVALADGYTPALGDEFTLWTCSKLAKEAASISLPTLPDGLYWDRSGLSEATGVLKVTDDASGIAGITTTGEVAYTVYNLAGVEIGNITSTPSDLKKTVANLTGRAGTYIIRCKAAGKTSVRKIVVK